MKKLIYGGSVIIVKMALTQVLIDGIARYVMIILCVKIVHPSINNIS